MAATDPQWRTERGEPWRLLTQWRRARDYYPRPEPDISTVELRPAMLDEAGSLEAFSRAQCKDNFGTRWFRVPTDQDHPMWTYAYLPWQLRFAREQPVLQAQLGEFSYRDLGPNGKNAAVDALLYQAFQIMCGYTDIIDCADPHALMH